MHGPHAEKTTPATAAVDYETDTTIQKSIRTQLSDVTLITVAHRLRTICDADKIVRFLVRVVSFRSTDVQMVLDAGRVVEFDSPAALLKNADGLFRSLVDGSADREELIAMANGS